jgi:hypothetical protein
MAEDWLDAAVSHHHAVTISGAVAAPIHAGLLASAGERPLDVTVAADTPAPWPNSWTSLQTAANSGLAEQAADLLRRGAVPTPRRGPRSPARLAMHHGHVTTLAALRDGGADLPPGSRPPAGLPAAVVLRNYLPGYAWWAAAACAALGLGLAVALWQWPFLIVAAAGVLAVVVANLVIGRTRLAVDGSRLAVRQMVRWQGPLDLTGLAGLGYAPATSRRMSGRWRLVQSDAGTSYASGPRQGFDAESASRLEGRSGLLVVTVYCNRGYLSPGFERLLASYVLASDAVVSDTARLALTRATDS